MGNFTISKSITDRPDDSLRILFMDLNRIKMISDEEEIELARRIKNGDKKAVTELVTANLRFCVSVAKQYQHKGLPLVDLIQEAVIGATKAAEKFDESRGFKFISYAVWWIRQAIVKALANTSRSVRIPTNYSANLSKLNRVIDKFEQKYQRRPTIEEIQDDIDLNEEKISTILSTYNKGVSLDNPIREGEIGTLADNLKDEKELVDSTLINNDLSKKIHEIVEELPSREHDLICMYFGIGMQSLTKEEIAARMGLTKERVRQLLIVTISNLKKNYSEELSEFI